MKTIGSCFGQLPLRPTALIAVAVLLAIPWAHQVVAQPRPFGISSGWTRSPYGDDSALAQRMRGSGTNFNIQLPPGPVYYPLPGPYSAYTLPYSGFGYGVPYGSYGYPAYGYNNWFPPAGGSAYGWNGYSLPQAPVVFGPVGLGRVGSTSVPVSYPTYYSLPPVAVLPYCGPVGYGVADFGFLAPWSYSVGQYSEVVIGIPGAGAVSAGGFPLRRRAAVVKAIPAFRDEFRDWDREVTGDNPLELLVTHPAALQRILSEPELPSVSARPVQAPENVLKESNPSEAVPTSEPVPEVDGDALDESQFPVVPDAQDLRDSEPAGTLVIPPAQPSHRSVTRPAVEHAVVPRLDAGFSNRAVQTVAVTRHSSPDPLESIFEARETALKGGRRLGESQAASRNDAASDSRPNVVFIAIDDLNDWIGCLAGHPDARTPHIDRLAAAGTLFRNAHCQGPLCGPSRASLLSGRFPHTTGIYAQPVKNRMADDTEMFRGRLLPEYFASHGYRTLGGGKITHGYPMKLAFQSVGPEQSFGPKPANGTRFHFHPPERPFTGTQTDWGAFPQDETEMPDDRIAAWAEEQLTADHDQPFFLAIGFIRPHVPFYVPQRWFDLFPVDRVRLPTIRADDLDDIPEASRRMHELPCYPPYDWLMAEQQKQLRLCVQGYLASTTFVDHQVGRVIAALRSGPHANNTIIVLFGDHGYHLGEKHRVAKHSLWEEATRVPLIVLRPAEITLVAAATTEIDGQPWTPQHIAAAPRVSIDGGRQLNQPVGLIDIFPTLVEMCGLPPVETSEGRSLVPLIEDRDVPWRDAILTTYARGNHSLRSERYRYIRCDDGSEELYDHASDDNEWRNLAEEDDMQSVLDHFRAQLPRRDAPYHVASSPAPVNAWFREHFRRNAVGPGTVSVE